LKTASRLFLSLAAAATLAAQELPEMDSDRPGFTEPAGVLERGLVQLESGITFFSESSEGVRTRGVIAGSPLVRLGLGARTEMRVEGDGYFSSSARGAQGVERARGTSDFAAGAKVSILAGHSMLPDFSVLPSLSFPVGDAQFSSSGFDPTLKLIWAKDLPGAFNVGWNINFASVSNGQSRVFQRAYSVSVAHDLPLGLGGYSEIFKVSPLVPDGPDNWIFNGGVTHALGSRAQIDVEAGRNFLRATPSWFVAAGFVVRGPLDWLRR
jgi:Putative MetA-pathway of phenol degradation